MRNIAIIPARSGSKGLKDKNVRSLCGIPLLAHTIICADKSRKFNKIFVSTDSLQYANIAEQYGADASFLRTAQNSGDEANSWDVVREVIKHFEEKGDFYDNVMLLQPTSPMRNVEDINNSFILMKKKRANAIISVTEMEHSPLWCNTLDENLSMDIFYNEKNIEMPRQKLPTYYRLNGAIYLIKREELDASPMFRKRSFAYIMPNERSIDIDSELDFKLAEVYMNARNR